MQKTSSNIQVFRYEALSQLSTQIFESEDLYALRKLLQKQLKYLFDYKLFRITFYRKKTPIILTFTPQETFQEKGEKYVKAYEKEVFIHQTPKHIPYNPLFFPDILEKSKEDLRLLSFYHHFKKNDVCISVVQKEGPRLAWVDATFIIMLSELIIAKYFKLIYLKKIDKQNKKLQKALREIAQKKRDIEEIVSKQEHIINVRTREIIEKNKTLLEINKINAHTLREPLSRILGLVSVASHTEKKSEIGLILTYLKTTAEELDGVLSEIIERSAQSIKESTHERKEHYLSR